MKIALYARVSTEEQAAHGLSIDAQLSALRKWSEGKTIAGEYVDRGVSARSAMSKRPQLQRLLRDVEAGAVDLIVFTKLDRWTRNIREYYKAADVLDAHGVAWRAIHEDYETETAAGRLKVNIMLAVAQDEADRTSERIKAVFAEKRRRGEALSGKTAIGIALVDKKLQPSEDADGIRRIFDYYIGCGSIRQTALHTDDLIGRRLSYGLTGRLLTNPLYVQAGVIDKAMFDRAQALRLESSPRNPSTGRVYLFSGLCRCAACGRKMSAHANGGGRWAYYYCRKQQMDKACDGRRSVSEQKIERHLTDNLLAQVEAVNLSIRKRREKPVDVAALQRKADKLADLYVNDLISREKYELEYRALMDRIAAAERRAQPVDVLTVTSALAAYETLSPEGKRAFWHNLIDVITIDPAGGITFSLLSSGA